MPNESLDTTPDRTVYASISKAAIPQHPATRFTSQEPTTSPRGPENSSVTSSSKGRSSEPVHPGHRRSPHRLRAAHAEVAGVGVVEDEGRHGGLGVHHVALRE